MKKLILTAFVLLGLILVSQAQKKHTIGEKFGGGIVFSISPDGLHGLIAKTQDQGMCSWNEAPDLIANIANNSAAGKAFTKWRLPEKDELDKLFDQREIVGGFTSNRYWSSTENGRERAWNLIFSSGDLAANGKTFTMHVRAVRKF